MGAYFSLFCLLFDWRILVPENAASRGLHSPFLSFLGIWGILVPGKTTGKGLH